MTDIDLDALERLAQGATRGTWCYSGEEDGDFILWSGEEEFLANIGAAGFFAPVKDNPHDLVAFDIDLANAKYLQAVQPTRLLALIQRLRAAEKDAERLDFLVDYCVSSYGDGYETPHENHLQCSWIQGAWIRDGSNGGQGRPDVFPGWRAFIDGQIALAKADEEIETAAEQDAVDQQRRIANGDDLGL